MTEDIEVDNHLIEEDAKETTQDPPTVEADEVIIEPSEEPETHQKHQRYLSNQNKLLNAYLKSNLFDEETI